MIDRNDTEGPPPSVAPFQYSLLSMLVMTAVFAVTCAGLFAGSDFSAFTTTTFWVVSLPAVLTIIVIYGEGRLRTFGLGALFPAGASLLVHFLSPSFISAWARLLGRPTAGRALAYFLLADFVATAAVGLLAVWTRWLIEESRRRQHDSPSDASPQ